MTIQELKALYGDGHSFDSEIAEGAVLALMPEVLALIETASLDDEARFKGSYFVPPIIKAVRKFSTRLAVLEPLGAK